MENENNPNQNVSYEPINNDVGQTINTPKSGTGSIIATIIIIALIILGGLYFWGKRIENERENRKIISGDITIDETAAVAEAVKTQEVSNDDSLSSLEAELGATNTSGINIQLE